MASASTTTARYSQEIAQMMFVFGEVKDPDENVVKYIEDVVQGQVAEIVVQARALAARRNSRYLSTEDLIFLIRHDRGKVNRLRTYLSWKEVRKRAKDTEGGGDGVGEIDVLDDVGTGADKTLKAHKMKIKIPWELTTIFSEHIQSDSEDEGDDDEREAYEDSKKRLKEADELTKHMTREEYAHYSDCRQASFTYRKAKRFREFVNFGAYIDGNPNDEVIDVLGFLSYEMVRSLCESGLEVKKHFNEAKKKALESAKQVGDGERRRKGKRGRGMLGEDDQEDGDHDAGIGRGSSKGNRDSSSANRSMNDRSPNSQDRNGNKKSRRSEDRDPDGLVEPGGLFSAHRDPAPPSPILQPEDLEKDPKPVDPVTSEPSAAAAASASTSTSTAETKPNTQESTSPSKAANTAATPANNAKANTATASRSSSSGGATSNLFAGPAVQKKPLDISDIVDAYTLTQRGRTMTRMAGMRNWRGGLARTKVNFI